MDNRKVMLFDTIGNSYQLNRIKYYQFFGFEKKMKIYLFSVPNSITDQKKYIFCTGNIERNLILYQWKFIFRAYK